MSISGTWLTSHEFTFYDQDFSPAGLFLAIFIHAHIMLVAVRSHANPKIFRRHPMRFVVVPIALYALMNSSMWILISVSVLATFWDVYHSGMQTFGFARIYDGRLGNDPKVGRRLDWWLNQVLYAGPILAGVMMMEHFGDFNEFKDVGSVFFTSIPGFMKANHAYIAWPVLIGGTLFTIYYVFAQWRLHQQGHQVSIQKVFLLASTGFVSIYTWGFNSWGEAFLIMNVFHAVQYYGIVWAMEKKNIVNVLRLKGMPFEKTIALAFVLVFTFSYGWFVAAVKVEFHALWSITLVVSIMHFWYDGFIWSVRKHQV